MLKRIKLCNIKYTSLAVQLFIPSTIAIFMKNMKGCNDMYNRIISKKREPVKSISKWKDAVLILVMQTGAKYLRFHTKVQKNQIKISFKSLLCET